jgi:hypothetical protein
LTSENVGREEKLMPQRRKPPWTAASIAAFRSVIKYGINDSLSLPIGERTKAVILTAVQGLRLREQRISSGITVVKDDIVSSASRHMTSH